jgi:hypothetical protein
MRNNTGQIWVLCHKQYRSDLSSVSQTIQVRFEFYVTNNTGQIWVLCHKQYRSDLSSMSQRIQVRSEFYVINNTGQIWVLCHKQYRFEYKEALQFRLELCLNSCHHYIGMNDLAIINLTVGNSMQQNLPRNLTVAQLDKEPEDSVPKETVHIVRLLSLTTINETS